MRLHILILLGQVLAVGHPGSQARQGFRRPNVLLPTEQDPAGAGKRTTTQKQGICRY